MIKLIDNQSFAKLAEMTGNQRNVQFERLKECWLTVKIYFGMFYLQQMARLQKSAIILRPPALSVSIPYVTQKDA